MEAVVVGAEESQPTQQTQQTKVVRVQCWHCGKDLTSVEGPRANRRCPNFEQHKVEVRDRHQKLERHRRTPQGKKWAFTKNYKRVQVDEDKPN